MSKEFNSKLTDLKRYFFNESDVRKFIDFLMTKAEVIAPQTKGEQSFAYNVVKNSSDVALEYPRTMQPLKKYFLPPVETLLTFKMSSNEFSEEVIEAKKQIFFGIHSYEMKGIHLLDYCLGKGKPESNYLKRRANALIIGISYKPDKYHFATSLGIDIEETEGFALFFEKVTEGYLVFVVTDEGAELIKDFSGGKPIDEQVNIEELPQQAKIKYHYNRLPQVFEHVYNSRVWDHFADKCVGCGTCNLLCPTCYCFDVRDEVGLNADDGKRQRFWDGCMLNSFAEVAGGENFRNKLAARMRHRLYRKFSYITKSSGELHCVGCGRCTRYCPADISIVEIINSLIEDYSAQQKKQAV
ncbi:MAG: 4Fe-4S dicluster domain-containing protein [Calditrichaceae bacterium]|nr:4Fe-4S dicluster domain-containing protein [Calditrichaceae bacterium]